MTRFHIVVTGTLALVIWAVLLPSHFMLGAALTFFVLITSVGVALPQFRFFGNFICHGTGAKKQVALTFDDGPDPRSTPPLLELLRARNIPATFFCIGRNVDQNPELAARITAEGHLLENHTYRHSYLTNFYGRSRLRVELQQTQAAIEKAGGAAPTRFRPPIGLSNPNTFRVARELNLAVTGWSVRSLDTVIEEPEKIVARIRRGLHPGAVILLHDGNIPVKKLLATVKTLLDTLRELGYEVVRLDELLK